MDCKAARLFLNFPGELAGPEAGSLAEHLATCAECDRASRDEARFDAHIGRAMRDVPLPAGLKQRLDARLAGGRAALRRKRLARWFAPLAAAAAALLLIGLVARLWPRSEIDAGHVQAMLNIHPVRSAEEADEAFKALGFSRAAPRFVDYNFLVCPPARGALPGYPGRLVPFLVFARGNQRALIFSIDKKRATLEGLDLSANGYTYRAEIYRVDSSSWDFLILHTGPDWDWLWQRPQVD